jgi:hypothetical protein
VVAYGQVAKFLLLSGHSNRTISEHWLHSSSLNSAVLREVIDIFLRKDMVDFQMIPPDPEKIPTEISSNPKFSPFCMIALVLLMVARYLSVCTYLLGRYSS